MCGIVSIHSSDNSLENMSSQLDDMLKQIFHRGPDGEGKVYIKDQVLLGHRRLAVIDLEHGQQPMVSEDGCYNLIFNGEIYNYLELRRLLLQRGIAFKTSSDTEVLLQMLIHFGSEALQELNGMFAFIFHDGKRNEWIAARDPFGIKPLYFYESDGYLYFASEIKCFLANPKFQARRNDNALHQYLAFQMCLDDETMFDGVKKIMPGHFLIGTGAEIKQNRCYWDTDYIVEENSTEEDFLEKISFTLKDSVRLQLRSDVPLGSHLSGGIDSSLVCKLASDQLGNSIPLFHGKFSESPDYDESKYARIVSEATNGILHEVIPSAQEFVETLPKLIYAMDEPVAGPGLFPQHAVSKLAKEHVKVVLGGQGGDELFGGYARYLVGYLEQALKGAIYETQEEGEHLVSLNSIVPHLPVLKQYAPLLSQFWEKGLFGEMDHRYFRLIDRSQGVQRLLHNEMLESFNKDYLFSTFQKVFNHPDTLSYINKMTHFDQKTLLPALLQVEDRVSMNVSLESRVPLLDTRIVDLVTKIPPPFKFHGGRTKHLLKETAKKLLPEAIINRKDKMGFPVPLKEWMQSGPVKEFVSDILLSQKSKSRGIYSVKSLEEIIRNPGVGSRQLWGALSLELWHQQFIDR